jgi:hypothetical protein
VAAAPALRSRIVRILFGVWTLGWIGMGLWVDHEIEGLTALSDTVVRSGQAIRQTADGLGSLGSLPFVGERIVDLERRVRAQADLAIASGRASRSNISRLAVLIGVSVALIPTVPPLAAWLLLRPPGRGANEARSSTAS